MGKKLVPDRSAEAERVRAYLRTPAGEEWSRTRIGVSLGYHRTTSGAFGSVLADGSAGAVASWPDPGIFDLGFLSDGDLDL